MIYLSVRDASRQLGMAERTIRGLADQYDWFGTPLGLDEGNGRPWVFTQEEVDRMGLSPRPGPGRPRKPIGTEAPVATAPIIPVDTATI